LIFVVSGPVILFNKGLPYVAGVSFMRHKCGLACDIPDLNVRVSSVLGWIQLNTIEGVCISPTKFFSNLHQYLFVVHYVLFALLGLLIYIEDEGIWIETDTSFAVFCLVYFGHILTLILMIAENLTH
jgi:hypothetical protein